jgi:hypothetical protein
VKCPTFTAAAQQARGAEIQGTTVTRRNALRTLMPIVSASDRSWRDPVARFRLQLHQLRSIEELESA